MVNVNYGDIKSIMMFPEEVDYVTSLIREMPDSGMMVEWGSGGSTCKWLETKQASQILITIEHNAEWYNKVTNSVNTVFGLSVPNFIFFHKEPVQGFYDHGFGGIEEENPFGLSEYMNPTQDVFNANLFFIDGIARGPIAACIFLRRKHLDSKVLIHDFSPRMAAYHWISQFCDIKFVGPTLAQLTYKT